VRLQGIVGVRQRRQFKSHGGSPDSGLFAVCARPVTGGPMSVGEFELFATQGLDHSTGPGA
ncbi:MAG: hypothetical protein ACN6OX_09080, partial [Pseudomonas sp.]